MHQRWCVWHVIARDNFSVWRWRGGSILSPSVKDILIKKVEKMKGGAVDARWYGAQRKFHFLPCTEKIVSAGKTWRRDGRFTLRTLITICSFPDNNRGEKMHESPLKWSRLSFPSLSRFFLFCGGRESISSPTCSSGPNHRISYYWRGSVCCIGCIAERRKRRGPRSNSPTFVSLSFSPPGRICILMEGFYRLLGGVRGTTSGIIKWTKPD